MVVKIGWNWKWVFLVHHINENYEWDLPIKRGEKENMFKLEGDNLDRFPSCFLF